MLILGIETTCDETAASVVRDGKEILSNIVASQEELHAKFGGVVPEIACRAHLESIINVIDRAVSTAKINLEDIDAIAIANTPGLVGAILVGLTAAKSLAWALNIPLIGITHLYAHLYSINFNYANVQYPLIGLIASGGHTSLFLIESETDYSFLGGTIDDAAGEAFDKVAKILGLGYPGGPEIDAVAKKGNKDAIEFPRSYLNKESLDFSFSGLKTAVLYHFHGTSCLPNAKNKMQNGDICELQSKRKSPKEIADIAASFQEAVVDVLVNKTILAYKQCCQLDNNKSINTPSIHNHQSTIINPKGITIGGGVARNSRLRTRLNEETGKMNVPLYIPSAELCTDNAVMVAGLAYHKFKRDEFADLSLEAIPNYQTGSS
ncbi:MAG: tRNA (adenosine(37)-N6)-threonylcarbamoyltransferase complex transferase subunit TsaD [Candidatus Anammoxibacter sp.]